MALDVEHHIKRLRDAEDSGVGRVHVLALKVAGTPKALDALAKYGLKSKYEDVKHISATSLAKLGDKRGIDVLIKMLDHEYLPKVVDAAEALGELGDKKALPKLMTLTGHKNKSLSREAKSAIKNIQEANDA